MKKINKYVVTPLAISAMALMLIGCENPLSESADTVKTEQTKKVESKSAETTDTQKAPEAQ